MLRIFAHLKLVPVWLFAVVLSAPAYSSESELPQVLATINGEAVTRDMVSQGSEMDIYQAEMKIYEIRLVKLRQILISKLIAFDPRSQGLSDEAYISQYVVKSMTVTDAMVDRFIAARKIPQGKIDAKLKQQVKQYIYSQDYARQLEAWYKTQAAKHSVAIHLPEPQEPRFSIALEGAAFIGPADAPVTLVEFADFECPYCVRAGQTVKQLQQQYGDKIKLVYKHLPLDMHANAQKAAEASVCAQRQDTQYFWQLHDKMFANSRNLSLGVIKDQAKSLGLDYPRFLSCLNDGEAANAVAQDAAEAKKLGLSATPAFFINGKLIKGAQDISVFQTAIEAELIKSNK